MYSHDIQCVAQWHASTLLEMTNMKTLWNATNIDRDNTNIEALCKPAKQMDEFLQLIFIHQVFFQSMPYWLISMYWANCSQSYKSHDHDHQRSDVGLIWLHQDERKHEHKVVRLVWDFDCLHIAQYISKSPHGIGCKQTWCKKIYHMYIISWLNLLIQVSILYVLLPHVMTKSAHCGPCDLYACCGFCHAWHGHRTSLWYTRTMNLILCLSKSIASEGVISCNGHRVVYELYLVMCTEWYFLIWCELEVLLWWWKLERSVMFRLIFCHGARRGQWCVDPHSIMRPVRSVMFGPT